MKNLFLWILLIFAVTESHAQGVPTLKMPNVLPPSTTEMMKFIDHPVDLAHGLANVEIPLYVLKEGDLEIPIMIKYHGSGIKLMDVPNGIGLGWALDFGPSLSRKINNIADEYGYLTSVWTPKKSASQTNEQYNSSGLYPYLRQLARGDQDEYPDEYYYKLLSNSGKYMFDRGAPSAYTSPNIRTMPFEPINITDNGITIVDDKGISYKFGSSSSGDTPAVALNEIGEKTSWKIREIISPNKQNIIYYDYSPFPYAVKHRQRPELFISIEETDIMPYAILPAQGGLYYPFVAIPEDCDSPVKLYNISHPDGKWPESGNIVDGKLVHAGTSYEPWNLSPEAESKEAKLASIRTKTIKIEMEWIGNWPSTPTVIKRMSVKDINTNSILKTMEFEHSNGSQPFLSRVVVKDKNGLTEQTYDFEYYPFQTQRWGGVDPWGYSFRAISHSIPRQTIFYTKHTPTQDIHGRLEEIGDVGVYPGFCMDGLLKSVTYPTGRKSTFYYEGNRVKRDGGSVEDTGGPRIQKIEEYEPISNETVTRTFKYGENENGGGRLKYDVTIDDYLLEYYNFKHPGKPGLVTRIKMFCSFPFGDPNYENGAIVSYEYVTEYVDGKGKTEYQFHEDESYLYHQIGTDMSVEVNRENGGSELLRKTEYKLNQTELTYRKIREERNTYGKFNERRIPYGMSYERLRDLSPQDEINYMEENRYVQQYDGLPYLSGTIYSANKKLTRQTIETFDGDRSSIQTINYEYGNPNHMYPTKQIVSGEAAPVTTSYLYPQDANTTEGQNLVSHNMLATLLQHEKSVGADKWITRTQYAYRDGSAVPLPVVLSEGPSVGNLRTMMEINKYDVLGNPVQIFDRTKNIVYLWGYGGHKLIAEIQNATYATVSAKLSQATIDGMRNSLLLSTNQLNALKTLDQIPGALVTIIEYGVFGVSRITNPNGKVTRYGYDDAGRLCSVIDENGDPIEEYKFNYSR
jgi:YD repeat-containing protein